MDKFHGNPGKHHKMGRGGRDQRGFMGMGGLGPFARFGGLGGFGFNPVLFGDMGDEDCKILITLSFDEKGFDTCREQRIL